MQADGIARFAEAGTQALEEYRQAGGPAAWPTEVRDQLGRAEAERVQQAREWQGEGHWPADVTVFARDILPRLADVSAGELARRTGLSVGYCRRIQEGGDGAASDVDAVRFAGASHDIEIDAADGYWRVQMGVGHGAARVVRAIAGVLVAPELLDPEYIDLALAAWRVAVREEPRIEDAGPRG